MKPLTEGTSFHTALIVMGCAIFLAWPLAILVIRDRASDKDLFPDGAAEAPEEIHLEPLSYRQLLKQRTFWLLLIGSCCSVGAISAVNLHMKFVFLEQGFNDNTPQALALLNSVWRLATMIILGSSVCGRLVVGALADALPKKWVMLATYFIVAATIPLLLTVRPSTSPVPFALLFGFGMGADFMLIPLMAAEQFGINSLVRAMAIILPVNTIGQTWYPYLVSILREQFGSYTIAMAVVFAAATVGALAILMLPLQPAAITPRLGRDERSPVLAR